MERFDIMESLRSFPQKYYRILFEKEWFSFWNREGKRILFIAYQNISEIRTTKNMIRILLENGIIHFLSVRTGKIYSTILDEDDIEDFLRTQMN